MTNNFVCAKRENSGVRTIIQWFKVQDPAKRVFRLKRIIAKRARCTITTSLSGPCPHHVPPQRTLVVVFHSNSPTFCSTRHSEPFHTFQVLEPCGCGSARLKRLYVAAETGASSSSFRFLEVSPSSPCTVWRFSTEVESRPRQNLLCRSIGRNVLTRFQPEA